MTSSSQPGHQTQNEAKAATEDTTVHGEVSRRPGPPAGVNPIAKAIWAAQAQEQERVTAERVEEERLARAAARFAAD